MSEKLKMKPITTPAGPSLWTRISKPNTKWNPDGEYEATVVLSEEENKDFLQMLDQLAQEAFASETEELKPAQKNQAKLQPPYKEELDEEGNPTGNVLVQAKMKARYKTKDGTLQEAEPAVFDAARPKPKQLDRKGLIIGNGSTIKINFQPRPYYIPGTKRGGISLQLRAVQVIDLRAMKGDAGSYGFAGENDGIAPMDVGFEDGSDF